MLGFLRKEYTYSTYGITTSDAQSNNPFQYTGRENDGDSLYYYRARYYSPTLQRFISWDPIGLRGGIDPYVYANGNPLQFRDPYGLWAWGDPLPQGVVDAAAGFGDGASFGATNWIRNQTGTNGVVNQCSAIYQGGVYVGFAFGAIATSGLGAEEEAEVEAVAEEEAQVTINRTNGNAFRDEVANLLEEAGFNVETEVCKPTIFGKRYIDIEVSLDGEVLGGIETKLGSSPYTSAQQAKDYYLWITQGYPVNLIRGPF